MIECETEAACRELAQLQEALVVDAILYTVIVSVAFVLAVELYRNRQTESDS